MNIGETKICEEVIGEKLKFAWGEKE